MCVCAQLLYTAQHRTVLIIFPFILQSIGEEGANAGESPTLATAVSMGNNYAITASLKISPIWD